MLHKGLEYNSCVSFLHSSQDKQNPESYFLFKSTKLSTMKQRICSRVDSLFLIFTCLSLSGSAVAYKNYTVGDSLGWYDNTEKANVNYQKWADGKNFSLGDFLIFNTDTNHSVVQTYNATTYKLCDYDNAQENDTTEWSSSDPSNTATHPVAVAVPLLKEGMTYFFSGDYDGDQCKSGMHFNINVTYGKGLPPSLKSPVDDAPAPNFPDAGGNQDTAPDTIVPANFDHPQDVSDVDPGDSGSVPLYIKFSNVKLDGVMLLLGIACLLA